MGGMNGDTNEPQEHPLGVLTEQAAHPENQKAPIKGRALRTLEGDIQEAVEEKNASVASIGIAEREKSRDSGEEKGRPSSGLLKKFVIVLASVVLVLVGAGAGYYLYLKSPLAPTPAAVPVAPAFQSVVAPDSQESIDLTGLGQGAVQAAIGNALSKATGAAGSIAQIVPFVKTAAGADSPMDGPDFLSLVGSGAPDMLVRSLDPTWMLGAYEDDGMPAPFIVVTDNFFQNAYAGMIDWEPSMADDLQPVFGFGYPSAAVAPSAAPTTATTTASTSVSTNDISSYFGIQGSWKDGVIKNKDVRVFSRPDGTVVLLYSFVDNDTLVITTDENALAEIIDRLEKQTFIR